MQVFVREKGLRIGRLAWFEEGWLKDFAQGSTRTRLFARVDIDAKASVTRYPVSTWNLGPPLRLQLVDHLSFAQAAILRLSTKMISSRSVQMSATPGIVRSIAFSKIPLELHANQDTSLRFLQPKATYLIGPSQSMGPQKRYIAATFAYPRYQLTC